MSALNISDYKKIIRERMGDYRFSHSVNVAKEAKKLAKHYGADENKAEIAGILHDITKEMPKEQQLQIIIDSGIILDNVQLHAPKLWHGMSGSIVVRDELGIDDEDILNAIRYHTTGRAGMSLLEKIVYIADYMEPGRKELPNMMDVRHLAFEDIDKCLYRILRDSLVYLKAQDIPIDQTTEETYQYYNELYSKH